MLNPTALAVFWGAAVAEIVGCYAFWMWLRLGRSPLWAAAGVLALVVFAVALTRVESGFAGRTYAAYGGIYILASILWLWVVEGESPSAWDLVGGALCLIGACVILFGAARSA